MASILEEQGKRMNNPLYTKMETTKKSRKKEEGGKERKEGERNAQGINHIWPFTGCTTGKEGTT